MWHFDVAPVSLPKMHSWTKPHQSLSRPFAYLPKRPIQKSMEKGFALPETLLALHKLKSTPPAGKTTRINCQQKRRVLKKNLATRRQIAGKTKQICDRILGEELTPGTLYPVPLYRDFMVDGST